MRKNLRPGAAIPWIWAGLLLTACENPDIVALTPSSGPPGTLVEVTGETFFAAPIWDAGTPQSRAIPGDISGAQMFSVPPDAAAGPHAVRLIRDHRQGTTAVFTVTAAPPGKPPRLDRLSLAGSDFPAGGKIRPWLFVQGANIDVGAVVLVDGTPQPAFASRALRNGLFGVDPRMLAYPIFHYLALVCAPGERDAGTTLAVQVRNLDGQVSEIRNIVMPAGPADLDSDGDDLPDQWELHGYDADGDGAIDVDLPALGADPFRPDILVEVDVMQDLTHPPDHAVFETVRQAFAAAPLIGGRAGDGVNLILDTSGTVPFRQVISMTQPDDADTANFYTLKNAAFDAAKRGRIFYYCIWGNAHVSGGSGVADAVSAGGTFTGPGNDFLVSFDDFGIGRPVRSGAETFMHELGHCLRQTHGGAFDRAETAYNPAFNSVMTYSWQMRMGKGAGFRKAHPTCAPFYYAADVFEPDGAIPFNHENDLIIGYSEGMSKGIDEANLDERNGGLCKQERIDWNQNGQNDWTVAFNVDGDQAGLTTARLEDWPNWANLVFGGPRLKGAWGN